MNGHTTKPNVEYLLNYLRANEDDIADSFPCGIEDLKQSMTILVAAPDLLNACKLTERAWTGDGIDMATAVDTCLLAITKAKTGR